MRRILSVLVLGMSGFCMTTIAASQGKLGTAVVSGPVLIDGQGASGSMALGPAARIATGDEATVTVTLGGGGEVRLSGQADLVLADRGNTVFLQLICGEVVVNSSVQATIVSREGGRVEVTTGKGSIMPISGKVVEVKQGKAKDFQSGDSVVANGLGSTITVKSKARCSCDCN